MGITETFPSILKRFRLRAGLSAERVSAKIAYSRSHYSNMEAGKRRCPCEVVTILDNAFGASGELIQAWEADEQMRRRQLLFLGSAVFAANVAVPEGAEPSSLGTIRSPGHRS